MLRADFKEVRALRAATPITITESRCGLPAVAQDRGACVQNVSGLQKLHRHTVRCPTETAR
jgi:hypothetical protein